MNKQSLFDSMKGRISMSSIKEYSGEYQIIGKFGMVSWMGDYWDIWLSQVHLGKELSERKLSSLIQQFESSVGIDFERLNGEAIGKVPDDEGAYLSAVLLKARRKRKASPKSIENLRKARLARVS